MRVVISAAVEGMTDAAVVKKLISHVGGQVGTVYGEKGKAHLKERIAGYHNAARHAPWLVLVDLDHDYDCAPLLRDAWLQDPAPHLCFRVAVRAVEAWLLADGDMLAKFLQVARANVPSRPESVDHPADTMVHLARASRRKEIQQDMVPRAGSGRRVGPAYASRLVEFIDGFWRPDVAAARADSLDRTLRCLRRLVEAAP